MGEENIGWDQSVATYPRDRLVARIGAKPWLYVQPQFSTCMGTQLHLMNSNSARIHVSY